MSVVYEDTLANTQETDYRGVIAKRVFKVQLSSITNGYDAQSLAETAAGIGIGDSFPGALLSYLKCCQISSANDKAPLSFTITYTYATVTANTQLAPSSTPVWSGGCSFQSAKTNEDNTGTPWSIVYAGVQQSPLINIQVPQFCIVANRVETGLSTIVANCLAYSGYVNSSTWTSSGGTFGANTMLLKITFDVQQSVGAGSAYLVKYEATYNANGWNPETVYAINPKTNLPDPTASISVNPFPTANFNTLSL